MQEFDAVLVGKHTGLDHFLVLGAGPPMRLNGVRDQLRHDNFVFTRGSRPMNTQVHPLVLIL